MNDAENLKEVAAEGYITTAEVMRRLAWSKRTLKAKVRRGLLREGEHFFQREGCHPRWKWSAVVRWLEGENRLPPKPAAVHLRISSPGRRRA